MLRSNMKASASVALTLWIVMLVCAAPEIGSWSEFAMAALFAFILAVIAGLALLIGLAVETPLYNWFKANEFRHQNRKGQR